jgi:hypothetical protein
MKYHILSLSLPPKSNTMQININTVKAFLDPELLGIQKTYIPMSDGNLVVKFTSKTPFLFSEVKSIISLLSHIDKYTRFGQLNTIIKTAIEVTSNEVRFDIWVDDINIDPVYKGNKQSQSYIEMMKSIKGLIINTPVNNEDRASFFSLNY